MEEMLSFMVGLVSFDAQILVEAILEAGLAPATLNIREFQRDVEMMINQFATLSLEEMDLEVLFRSSIETIYKHRISLPADLLGVARAISTMEGIARQIYPEYNPVKSIQPYLVSLFVKRALDPAHQADQMVDGVIDFVGLLRQLPRDVSDVVKRLKEGELTLRVHDPSAVEVARVQARARNRMVGALLSLTGLGATFYLQAAPGVGEWVPWTSFTTSFCIAIWVVMGVRKSGGM
jgi:ubiquinone biosynthesis protein